jgi:hypothetical protein
MVAQTQQDVRPLVRPPEARPVQPPIPQPHTLIAYLGDLDTYRRGPVWHTIWHKEALPHGLEVQAFRSLGGQTHSNAKPASESSSRLGAGPCPCTLRRF